MENEKRKVENTKFLIFHWSCVLRIFAGNFFFTNENDSYKIAD